MNQGLKIYKLTPREKAEEMIEKFGEKSAREICKENIKWAEEKERVRFEYYSQVLDYINKDLIL